MTTRTIIYCRFSPRPNADECTSNEKQLERCGEYCYHKKYMVAHSFQDRNVSGGTLDRPQLRLALDSLGTDDVLVVDTVDRLARDQLVMLLIQQRVMEAGARIEYANGTPPPTTPEGELIGGILSCFAQYQRAVIRGKTKAGLDRKREEGIVGGRTPIGYRRENGKLVEDEKEQIYIKHLMLFVRIGHAPGWVASRLQELFGPIRGRRWNERTIRRIFKRETEKAKKLLDS